MFEHHHFTQFYFQVNFNDIRTSHVNQEEALINASVSSDSTHELEVIYDSCGVSAVDTVFTYVNTTTTTATATATATATEEGEQGGAEEDGDGDEEECCIL